MEKESSYSLRFVNCDGNEYLTSATADDGTVKTNPAVPTGVNTSYDFYVWGLVPL